MAALYDAAVAGPDGQVTLVHAYRSAARPATLQQLDVTPAGGGPITAGTVVDLGDFEGTGNLAVDPEDGTVWLAGGTSQRVQAVCDGRVVANQYFKERHPRGGFLVAGPDHIIYAQASDGTTGGIGQHAPPWHGARFTRLGLSPGIVDGPASRSVTLAAGDTSAPVTFTSTGDGTPAPARRWQVKAPGAARFADVPGAAGAGATLAVDARRGMDGTQYRAVYANAAGRAASAVATLGVDYAPRVAFDPVDATVVEGRPASFQVLADGHPEPALTWQRRVGGFWEDVAPDDEDVTIDGATLTIGETNVDQSGTLFRVRARNAVGVVTSKAARLTVAARATEPRALTGVRLDWTGSDELQALAPNRAANFFSAGVSDGGEPTYRAASAGVRVLHVAAGGAETPATWATRAAHAAPGGGEQVVRLVNGTGRIAADGSAKVSWKGAFSVNFYGGLVPFTVSDVTLAIDPDGDGTLTGDLSGYGSSQSDPAARHPVAPVDDVVIATFRGGRVDPDGAAATIIPNYAGVTATLPAGFAPQDRAGAGWGAWPQPFVDFQVATGLAPYWYASGGAADAKKPPRPFTVTVTGRTDEDPRQEEEPPAAPEPELKSPAPAPIVGQDTVPPTRRPAKAAWVTARRATQRVGRDRAATLATLSCPKGGAACAATVPARVTATIGGRRFTLAASAARTIRAGRAAALTVRLPRAAVARLKGRTATVRVTVVLATGGVTTTRTIAVKITLRG